MFIQTESTPNPNTVKFIPGQEVLPGNTAEFTSPESAEDSPLAIRLFDVPGVSGVFLGHDFISVTREPEESWDLLKTRIMAAIMDHFTSGLPVLNSNAVEENVRAVPDDELSRQIIEIIDTRIQPAVAMDGGYIGFSSFDQDTGIVYLELKGACAGCPSATMTLKSGIENMLKHFVPEVQAVEAINL
jgi:Fe-S cluster biogenesis protein NfuA